MKLYCLKLHPLSAWRTPWQADTLAGLLCWAMARKEGNEALRREILDKCAAGNPPFVLSDAFPEGFLPVPEIVRLQEWANADRKKVKRARLLRVDIFRRVQSGLPFSTDDLNEGDPFCSFPQTHNTLDRTTDTTAEGGAPFVRSDTFLAMKQSDYESRIGRVGQDNDLSCLNIYARIEDGFVTRLLDLFRELAATGFGADISTGKGQFEVVSEFEDTSWLDETQTNGIVSLSTFHPAANDPTEGFWQTFVKYGKVGPDFGLENVFKRPLLMLQPGACFKTDTVRPFIGRAVAMNELLAAQEHENLCATQVELFQLCYGLTVPCAFQTEEK